MVNKVLDQSCRLVVSISLKNKINLFATHPGGVLFYASDGA